MLRNFIVSLALTAFLLSGALAQNTVVASSDTEPQQSLADIAKAIRAKKKPEVVIDQNDAEKLFSEVDSILNFASQSSELPKHSAVKYKLVGREDVDKRFAEDYATARGSKDGSSAPNW